MSNWAVTWFDGMHLRQTLITMVDPWNLVNAASGAGVMTHAIIKIERVPT